MRIKIIIACVVFASLASGRAKGLTSISMEAAAGSAYNIPTWLEIHQSGKDESGEDLEPINLDNARYDTRPFYDAPYYMLRVGFWFDDRAWEFEMIHHKIYLGNEPDEVDHFNISHGYNLMTVNRVWEVHDLHWRLGAGIVLAHPEIKVRGKELDPNKGGLKGFYATGPAAQVALGKRFFIGEGFFVGLEAKFTAAHAAVPVYHGQAYAPNLALHGLFVLGYDVAVR